MKVGIFLKEIFFKLRIIKYNPIILQEKSTISVLLYLHENTNIIEMNIKVDNKLFISTLKFCNEMLIIRENTNVIEYIIINLFLVISELFITFY